MHFPSRLVAVFVAATLLLAACDKPPAEQAKPASLTRPLLLLDTKAGRMLVPQAAIVERGGIPGVFVLTEEGQARFRMVRTGKTVNGRIEILSGLNGSETLVADDLRDVHDGSLIQKK
jgi:hypothetical protein